VRFLGNIVVTAVWKVLADRTKSPAVVGYAPRLRPDTLAAAATPQLVTTNLRKHRRQRVGVSQEAQPVSSRRSRTECSLLERGERDTRASTLVRIADALAIGRWELCSRSLERGMDEGQ